MELVSKGGGEKGKSRKIEKCGSCNKNVGSNSYGVECEICGLWYHIECQDVCEQLYKALTTFGDHVHWFCKTCNKGAEKILTVMSKIQVKIDHLELETSKLQIETKEEIKKLSTEIDVMKMEINDLKKDISKIEKIKVELHHMKQEIGKIEHLEGAKIL